MSKQHPIAMDDVCDLIFDGENIGDCAQATGTGDIDGDGYTDLIIGARYYNSNQGRAYLYYGGSSGLSPNPDVVFEGEPNSYFGEMIGIGDVDNDGDDDIIIAATRYDDSRGRVYLFWGANRTSINVKADLVFEGENVGDSFGGVWDHIICDDIDGDSYADIVIPAPGYGADGQGRAYLYWGDSRAKMDTVADLIFMPPESVGMFGSSLDCGDIDNDRHGDIIIGANERAYLFWGDSKMHMDAICDVILDAKSSENNGFGSKVAVGDIDNDGYRDIFVGSPDYEQDCAYLYWGDVKANMDGDYDLTFIGEKGSKFGEFALIGGDINGDGYGDVICGGRGYDNCRGRAYLFYGSKKKKMDTHPDLVLTGENEREYFCVPSSGSFGDFNNDNFDDFVIGASKYHLTGRVYLYNGGPHRGNTKTSPKSKRKPTTIHHAAACGDMNQVEVFISRGVDINGKDKNGKAPLHYAVEASYKEMVKLLLANGANINCTNNDGQTPIRLAMMEEHRDIVTLLATEDAEMTLHMVAYMGDSVKVKELIRKGVNINEKNDDGRTPLQISAWYGHLDVFKLLIDNGADADVIDENGTILDVAARQGYQEIVQLLLDRGVDVDGKSNEGWTPLISSCRFGHEAVVRLLVAKGANVNTMADDGWTPLYAACRCGNKNIVELILNKGATINVRTYNGSTPLHISCQFGHREIVTLLVKWDADIDVVDKSGRTGLHYAAERGDNDTVKLLTAKGAKIDTKDNEGWSPLLSAIRYNNWQVVEFLINKGADFSIKNALDRTPLHKAAEQGQREVAGLLIAKGVDVNVKDRNSDTPLHYAAYSGNKVVAELLLSQGADVDSKDKWGWTVLHRLAARGHKEMAELLIREGANVNVQDWNGKTPLSLAKENGHTEIVDLFRRHGAKE